MTRVLFVLSAALAWLGRVLRGVRLCATGRLAETNTMAEWKALQSQPDDPLPQYVRPDPSAPYADLIRRVRLYAKDGAKALAPLLDAPLSTTRQGTIDSIIAAERAAQSTTDAEAANILGNLWDDGGRLLTESVEAIHAAYNSPWTIGSDGEPMEMVQAPTSAQGTAHVGAMH